MKARKVWAPLAVAPSSGMPGREDGRVTLRIQPGQHIGRPKQNPAPESGGRNLTPGDHRVDGLWAGPQQGGDFGHGNQQGQFGSVHGVKSARAAIVLGV